MQRLLNKDYGLNVSEISFLSDFRMPDLSNFIEITSQICTKCGINRKTHYCVEPDCQKRQLICWNCEPNDIQSEHFLHQYAYCLPMFSKNIYDNFTEIGRNLAQFLKHLITQITLIKQYLTKLQNISKKTQQKIRILKNQYESSLFNKFQQKVKQFQKKYYDLDSQNTTISSPNKKRVKNRLYNANSGQQYKIKYFFNEVKFYSAHQCMKKQQEIIKQLLQQVNGLQWIKDPQKQLRSLLQARASQPKKDAFLGSHKKIQITEIDHFYKINNQFLTENLKTHKIQLKVQSEFLNKTKFYQALIYHLKDIRRLSIQNAHINQIRTPLTFKHLQQLQFSCNTETQPYNLRIQQVGQQLQTLIIRKIRQQQIKIVKPIIQNTQILKKIHLQFYNKFDLSTSKDICQFFTAFNQNQGNQVIDFHIKIRTQGQVKRTYGYLAKFYRQPFIDPTNSQVNNCQVSIGIRTFLQKNSKIIYKLDIQGIRNIIDMNTLQILQKMPRLLILKIRYDSIDLVNEINQEKCKRLYKKIFDKKKIFCCLCRHQINRKHPKNTIHKVFNDFLMN